MFKKISILSTFIIGSLFTLNAQTLSIGPVAGINISKFSDATNAENLVGLSVGALANYSVNEHVGLSAKLLYSQLGSTYANTSAETRLNYVQLPVSFVYYFGQAGNKIRPKIYAGPYLGYLINTRDENGNSTDLSEVLNRHDIGGQIGLGLNYLIQSRTWFNLDLGYSASFTDIAKSEAITDHNTAFTINAGVSFPIFSE